MSYNEELSKAKELKEEADILDSIIDSYINDGNFKKATSCMGKKLKLLEEYAKLYEIGTKLLIEDRIKRTHTKKSVHLIF